MISDNKYYTPTIEEFYFEFEYEELIGEEWIPRPSFNIHDHCIADYDGIIEFDLYNLIENKKVRVKYLDQEDIESLGFKQDSLYSFRKNDWIIEVNLNELHIGKDTLDIYLVSDLRFKGTIKNKSELVKLLKQLGINE